MASDTVLLGFSRGVCLMVLIICNILATCDNGWLGSKDSPSFSSTVIGKILSNEDSMFSYTRYVVNSSISSCGTASSNAVVI